MSITHDLKNLSEQQISDIELTLKLIDNLNSIKPFGKRRTTLKYDGKTFKVEQNGFLNKFLVDDVNQAIKKDFESHKKHIINSFQYLVNEYKTSSQSAHNLSELENISDFMFKYYGYESDYIYPLYLDKTDFRLTLENIRHSINSLIK